MGPSWILIRIPYLDTDPLFSLNSDQIGIPGSETLITFTHHSVIFTSVAND
jgi:hypothetical protein